MNNIQRADVTLLHGLWMTKLHFARHRQLPKDSPNNCEIMAEGRHVSATKISPTLNFL
jgi:hypothetical protein